MNQIEEGIIILNGKGYTFTFIKLTIELYLTIIA